LAYKTQNEDKQNTAQKRTEITYFKYNSAYYKLNNISAKRHTIATSHCWKVVVVVSPDSAQAVFGSLSEEF
jgi:hypothetical protein